MTVTDITHRGIHISIINDSVFDIYYWGNIPWWHHYEHRFTVCYHRNISLDCFDEENLRNIGCYHRNISLDYFDGESWRNIPRPVPIPADPADGPIADGVHCPIRNDMFRHNGTIFEMRPFAATTELLYLTWIDPDNLPEPGERLFRVRKDIHADRTMNLARLWRVYYARHQEEGEGIWRGVPTVIRHTLVAEFYWDGQIPVRDN